MTLTAVQGARPAVVHFVAILDRHINTPVIKWPPQGQGEARALRRLAAKRKANEMIPTIDKPKSRQVRRREERPWLRRRQIVQG